MANHRHPRWWLLLAALWGLATAADRLWLQLDRRLPSWDQADYLNSAQDHGRALGLLPDGGWTGWQGLLDLSPKIPPLASLVNGTVMAISGDTPDQASWALALWHALLLVAVACWGRQLGGRGFGLLAAALVACAPALASLRVDFTLDLPLAATSTLALWLVGRWQAPDPEGGRWGQALAAALAVAAALLVKQSALLLVAVPCLWAASRGLGCRRRRVQGLVALAIVIGICLPWLRHNWITTLGGTNRAVLESASEEGDPALLSWASLLWYPRRWPRQLGVVTLVPALAALLAALWRWRGSLPAWLRHPVRHLPPGWAWLIGCTVSGWLLTTLSPNKDARYTAPILPLLILLLARGWWQIGLLVRSRFGRSAAAGLLAGGLLTAAMAMTRSQAASLQRQPPPPLAEVIGELRRATANAPITLLVVPGSPELNEQNVTTFGQLQGGRILGRRLGRRQREHALVLEGSEWILLATGDQGTNRPHSRELSHRVRADGRFVKVKSWPWSPDREVELWRRRTSAQGKPGEPHRFDRDFIQLARGMERGPAGLAAVFRRIGAEHQLDGHFLYQKRVRAWADQRLKENPRDADALWSQALLATLRNRPEEANLWYGKIQSIDGSSPWPPAYRAVVLMAGWNPWKARDLLESTPESVRRQPVVQGLLDLSRLLGGNPLALGSLRNSLPEAIREVKQDLKKGT